MELEVDGVVIVVDQFDGDAGGVGVACGKVVDLVVDIERPSRNLARYVDRMADLLATGKAKTRHAAVRARR